jgi:hypothetical protein
VLRVVACPSLLPSYSETVHSIPAEGTVLVGNQDTGREDRLDHLGSCFWDPHMVRNQVLVHILASVLDYIPDNRVRKGEHLVQEEERVPPGSRLCTYVEGAPWLADHDTPGLELE